MTKHIFTKIIHSRGWTVTEACEYWGLRYGTYIARCNNEKLHNQLMCMCKGLKNKIED